MRGEKKKRVTVYLPTRIHDELRDVLLREGRTLSGWFYMQALIYLNKKNTRMKMLVPVLFIAALLAGCTTTQVQTVDNSIVAATPIVQPIVSAAINLGLGYIAEKNGTGLAKLRSDINPIADKIARGSTLASAASGNLMTPKQFCELLKVEDDDLTRVLQTLVPLYSQYYTEWQKDPTNEKIFAYSKCVLDGLSLLARTTEQATR